MSGPKMENIYPLQRKGRRSLRTEAIPDEHHQIHRQLLHGMDFVHLWTQCCLGDFNSQQQRRLRVGQGCERLLRLATAIRDHLRASIQVLSQLYLFKFTAEALGLGTAGLSCPPGGLTNAEMLRLLVSNQAPPSPAAGAPQAGDKSRTAVFGERRSSDTDRGRGTHTEAASWAENTGLEPAWCSFLEATCSSSELAQTCPEYRPSLCTQESQSRPQGGRTRPSGLCRDTCADFGVFPYPICFCSANRDLPYTKTTPFCICTK